MIEKIILKDAKIAEEFLNLQQLSYRVEAEIIGFAQIPPLFETIQDLLDSEEHYLGYFDDGKLVGALSYEMSNEENIVSVHICKMIVHPEHFKKGIASQLLRHLFEHKTDADEFVVSTGAKNDPAIQLYKKFGFVTAFEEQVHPDLSMVTLKKRLS